MNNILDSSVDIVSLGKITPIHSLQSLLDDKTLQLIRTILFVKGGEHQLRKFQEECCEAGAAVNHYVSGRTGSSEALAIEIIDVLLVALSAYVHFHDNIDSKVIDNRLFKTLERLESRLVDYQNGNHSAL